VIGTKTQAHVSTWCINPEQPHADAMACEPFVSMQRDFKEGAHVGPSVFAEHFCYINKWFPTQFKMRETLGPALLRGCFEPTIATQMLPDWIVKKVKDACEGCRPEALKSGVGPTQLVKLPICKIGEFLCIKEFPRAAAVHEAALVQQKGSQNFATGEPCSCCTP